MNTDFVEFLLNIQNGCVKFSDVMNFSIIIHGTRFIEVCIAAKSNEKFKLNEMRTHLYENGN